MLLILDAAGAASRPMYVQEVKALAKGGDFIQDADLLMEGVVISDQTQVNRDISRPAEWAHVGTGASRKTVYVQNRDASAGIRLVFKGNSDAKVLKRFSTVTLNLKGCTVTRDAKGGVTVDGLGPESVVRCVEGSQASAPIKKKKIHAITEADLYTLVCIPNCEFVFKTGSYTNVYEPFMMRTSVNEVCLAQSRMMNTWACLFTDGSAPMYMYVNAECPWRRDGKGLPGGRGEIEGIVVSEYYSRYGSTGDFQILPQTQEDIRFGKSQASALSNIALWNWNDGSDEPRLTPDSGCGELTLSPECMLSRSFDTDNPATAVGKVPTFGIVENGALRMSAPSCAWWRWGKDQGTPIEVKVSTKGLKGRALLFAFSFSAGGTDSGKAGKDKLQSMNAQNCHGFPVYWKISYSTDGSSWEDVPGEVILRSLPWYWKNQVDGARDYPTSFECGPGFTEHAVMLPSTLLGKDTVYIRLSPSRKVMASLAIERADKLALREDSSAKCIINIGALQVSCVL